MMQEAKERVLFHHHTLCSIFFFLLLLQSTCILTCQAGSPKEEKIVETKGNGNGNGNGRKVAIIGGGIGGTFTAKYLSDYDTNCELDSITIYEPFSILDDDANNIETDADADAKEGNAVDVDVDVDPSSSSSSSSTTTTTTTTTESATTTTTTTTTTRSKVIPVPIAPQQQQGSRVSSLTLEDGTVVELGASIIFNGNKLTREMLENDTTLEKTEPLASSTPRKGQQDAGQGEVYKGMGIFNGYGNGNGNDNDGGKITSWPLMTSNMTKEETKSALLWRYNIDLYKISKITDDALQSFDTIYDLLESNTKSSLSYMSSPTDIWKYAGLDYAASVSLDTLLDDIGVARDKVPFWKEVVLGYFVEQGLVRDEFFTAMNICNNNKNNAQMTGLAGLVNFCASKGELFAIKGGNHKLIQSAFQQTKSNYKSTCSKTNNTKKVIHVPTRIETIVSDFENIKGMELFDSNGQSMGMYDVVILAAPLQFAGINFLTKGSLFDKNVLHPMSLNGMVKNSDYEEEEAGDINANDHGHEAAWKGGILPDSAIRPYTQVVTTVVSNATLNMSHFYIDKDDISTTPPSIPKPPKSILFTQKGKEESGISSIGQIASDVFKIFSSNEVGGTTLSSIFGEDVKVEYIKVWGEKNGGATPDFNGGGDSSLATQFLLYDGGHGVGTFDDEGSALYYVNSMESAVSAIEISAIGAKAVSKLVAHRLQLLKMIDDFDASEEL